MAYLLSFGKTVTEPGYKLDFSDTPILPHSTYWFHLSSPGAPMEDKGLQLVIDTDQVILNKASKMLILE